MSAADLSEVVRAVARWREPSQPPEGVSVRTWRRLRAEVAAGRAPRTTRRTRAALHYAHRAGFPPGVYNLPEADYHADPVPGGSLSSTGARLLLRAPALFRHRLDNPEPPRRIFDVGSAAHKLVLGTGPEIVLVDRDRWDTKAVKEQVAEIRDRGAIPLKRLDYEQVHGMAAALREHPLASGLLRPDRGRAEQTLIWQDDITRVWCRALVDWLPHRPDVGRRMILPDYKTADDASPAAVARAIARYGYHVQGAWYCDGVLQLGLADDVAFVLIVQETQPPHLVTVTEIGPESMMWARMDVERALRVYRACQSSGQWSGYGDDVMLAELPTYLTREYEAARDRGDYDALPEGTDNI